MTDPRIPLIKIAKMCNSMEDLRKLLKQCNVDETNADNIISDQLTWDSKDDALKNSMEHHEWIGAYEVEVEI